jgi:AcrR family transcriptional regulator
VDPSRTYRGVTPAERQAERRERLMEASVELFGTLGYARTSVRAVSAAASLNSRYFYESFSSREDLLCAVYQRIMDDIFARASDAVAREDTLEAQARAGLRAAWTAVTEDRRKARIVALEVVGVSERLERMRRETRQALAQLTADNALSLAGPGVRLRLDPVLTARFLMGGVVEVLLEWIHGDLDAPPDDVIDHFTALFTAAAHAAVADDLGQPASARPADGGTAPATESGAPDRSVPHIENGGHNRCRSHLTADTVHRQGGTWRDRWAERSVRRIADYGLG